MMKLEIVVVFGVIDAVGVINTVGALPFQYFNVSVGFIYHIFLLISNVVSSIINYFLQTLNPQLP